MRANSRVSIGVLFLKGGRAHIRSAEGPLTQICGWVEFGGVVFGSNVPLDSDVPLDVPFDRHHRGRFLQDGLD